MHFNQIETFREFNMRYPFRVVNLARCPERMEHMKAECEKHELSMVRFEAVNGREVPYLPGVNRNDEKWLEMSNGQKGCAMSHVRLLQDFLASGEDYLCVLEDDAIFCDNFLELADQYMATQKTIDPDFDLIYLGNQCVPNRDGIGVRSVPTFCTHGLIWSRTGAQKMFDLFDREGLWVIDIVMIHAHTRGELKAYSWIKAGLNSHESTLDLYQERSSGLVFQSRAFECTIHG